MSQIIKSSYVLDFYPITCGECPFLTKHSYRDGGYTGVCYSCRLGYMAHGDTREFQIDKKRWKDCCIMGDSRVSLM